MRLERAERLEDLRDVWDELALGAGHPFGTWEWVEPWWRRFGGGRRLFTFAVLDDDGRTAAILPLYLARSGRFPVARFIGYADLHSPLCAPDDRPLAAAGLRALLGRGPDRCRLLVAEKMPGDQLWAERLDGRLIGLHPDPVLNLNGRSFDEFLASQTRNFRSQTRRQERRLIAEHGLTYRLSDDPERLDEDIDTLFSLHSERFGEESTGIFEGSRGEMQREVMRGAFDRGWLRLWISEVDGEAAAAYYGWRFGEAEWLFQSGRNRKFERLSVGAVLLAHVIRDMCESGVSQCRFLAGGEEYKKRYADDDIPAQSVALGRGLVGRAAVGVTSRVFGMSDAMRARVLG